MRTTGYGRYLALINCGLAVTAAVCLVRAGIVLFDKPESGTGIVSDVTGVAGEEPMPTRDDYEVIARRDIFSEPAPIARKPAPARSVPVKSDDGFAKNMKLVGTIAGDEEYACAIIEDGKGIQGMYGRGEHVAGAQIVEVARNRVVLQKGEARHVLYAYTDNDIMARGGRAMAAADGDPAYERTSNRTWRVNASRLLAEYGNVNELLGQAHFQPRIENGRCTGIAVAELADKSIFGDLGIRNNDIISAINGKPVTGMRKAYDLIKDVSSAQLASINVVRDGQQVILRYHLEK